MPLDFMKPALDGINQTKIWNRIGTFCRDGLETFKERRRRGGGLTDHPRLTKYRNCWINNRYLE